MLMFPSFIFFLQALILKTLRAPAKFALRMPGVGKFVYMLFLQSLVYISEQARTDVEFVEGSAVAGRVHTVCEEHEYYVLFRIYPEHRSGESEVAEYFWRGLVACR